jgi:16S rRNA (uracil1498-N3)-methyltransferase
MHERRIFINLDVLRHESLKDLPKGFVISLDNETSHYLSRVLRLRAGNTVIVANSECSSTESAEIYLTKIDSNTTLTVLERCQEEGVDPSSFAVHTIALALSKGDTIEYVIEKGVELGVSRILLWKSERSIPVYKTENDLSKKLNRWRKIALSAAQQSGRVLLTTIEFASSAVDATQVLSKQESNNNNKTLICSLAPDATPVSWIMQKHLALSNQSPLSSLRYNVIIGPEGDLSPDEEEIFRTALFEPITLGNRRLKVDTAAIFAIAMIESTISTMRVVEVAQSLRQK